MQFLYRYGARRRMWNYDHKFLIIDDLSTRDVYDFCVLES